MRPKAVFSVAVLLCASWALAAAQVVGVPQQAGQGRDAQAGATSPVTATGLLMGQVTMAGTGQPVEGVRVTLSGATVRGSRNALTNEEGEFAFLDLPAGTFTVRGTLTGHIAGTYGQKAPGKPGTAIVLLEGQQFKNASFEIARGGVITGVVFDEKNRPSIGTPVRAMRWVIQSGERALVNAGSATTDDRGIYRMFNLTPGEYIVSAMPRNTSVQVVMAMQAERTEELRALGLVGEVAMYQTAQQQAGITGTAEGYAPVFFPGTTDVALAQPVRVGIAEEQQGVDFPLQRVTLTTVTGHVVVPPGQSPTTVQVRLLQASGSVRGVGQMSTRVAQNGTFTFRSVVPGQYIVYATATVAAVRITGPLPNPSVVPPPPPPPGRAAARRRLWAQTDLFVDGSYPPAVSLSMQDGLDVSGQLSFVGSAPLPADMRRVRVTMNPLGQPLQSVGVGSWSTNADPSGRFTVAGIVPGRYRINATGASGWQVKSVIVSGVDVLDFPFIIEPGSQAPELAIQFGDRHTELRGRLADDSGAGTPEYSVIIFPDDQRYWIPFARRMRSARPATDGTFAFMGLPAGEYRLAAVTDVEPGEWLDPEFLRELLPASIGVRLVDGQPVTQDLRVR
jgi:hypothetical protein